MKNTLRICLGLLLVFGATQWGIAADNPAKTDGAKAGSFLQKSKHGTDLNNVAIGITQRV